MGLPPRHSRTVPAPPRSGGAPAFNPNLILAIRFLLSLVICGLSLVAAILAILVVQYYNSHDPIIRPSWGSLIFIIVLGLATPCLYFGYNILLPIAPFINYGDFLYGIMMVKIELLFQFAMAVLWVSGALAYANDLRGYENCTFDGYYHYDKPADFNHVCDLTNYVVPVAYAAFGVQALLFAFELLFGLYTFLYLDQESLSEPHFAWGRRAYDYRTGANQSGSTARGNAYRARAINADEDEGHDAAAAQGAGRRGAAYQDPERGSSEMGEALNDGPATLGSRGRGRRGYADDDDEDPHSAADAYSGIDDDEQHGEWHLREEHRGDGRA